MDEGVVTSNGGHGGSVDSRFVDEGVDDSDVVHCREVDKGGVISRPTVRKLSTEQVLDKDFTLEDKDGIGGSYFSEYFLGPYHE